MKIYLALYKGKKGGQSPKALALRLADWVVRKATDGIYAHCEIAVAKGDGKYDCYTASLRDGGVRVKTMPLPTEKWDLIELRQDNLHQDLAALYQRTKGKSYDYWGALGVVMGRGNSTQKWFCSEWCAVAIGLPEPWRYSPNNLAKHLKSYPNG